MRRALLCAALLVCALPAAAAPAATVGPAATAPAATEPVEVLDGGPRLLRVGDEPAQGYGGTELRLGTALGDDATALQGAFDAERIRVLLAEAEGPAARAAVVDRQASRIGDALTRLSDREQTAVREFAAGNLSERALLQRLGEIHAAASAHQSAIRALVAATTESSFPRLNTLSHRAETLRGPVRGDLAAGTRTVEGSRRVFVAATADGVSLAALTADATYVRETVRFDVRDDEPLRTTFENATRLPDYVSEQYPWAWDNFRRWTAVFPGGIHQVTIEHPLGSLRAYVDGSVPSVFREVHRLAPDRLESETVGNATNGSVSLRVNRTFGGGPMRVEVTQRGGPVDAPVFVDGERVGSGGPDGTLWAVAPRASATVRTTVGGQNVSVTVPNP